MTRISIAPADDPSDVDVFADLPECFSPHQLIDLTVPGADWGVDWRTGGFRSCRGDGDQALSTRQYLEVGWGDLGRGALDVTGLPNGRYVIGVTLDPADGFLESDETDNFLSRTIRVKGRTGARRVVVPPLNGADTG